MILANAFSVGRPARPNPRKLPRLKKQHNAHAFTMEWTYCDHGRIVCGPDGNPVTVRFTLLPE